MARLLVVATPIGNLGDLTARTRDALERADLIAAEDTRVTMKLLNHYDLKKPMTSLHRHNEAEKAPGLARRMLEEDLTVALTCDAGTPGISDPGHLLVDACWEAGIPVEPIPGPSAVATALSASGFDAREFAFYGFLPREMKPLRDKLGAIRSSGISVFVLYESPHRVVQLTEVIAEMFPASRLAVMSDLTKRFERIYRGTSPEVRDELAANENVEKGEYCLVCDLSRVETPEEKEEAPDDARVYIVKRMLSGEDMRAAMQSARDAGFARNDIYRARLDLERLFGEEEE
ncbi:MAG: 16S rRNA (cytidine(1402)-2'-O)-methyltransferase [Clostridiales bacterium]|nr:16S rRNA (cytidine(1402)-2'-O)-methyltransferase [Clostridiales bacterium]